MGLIDIVWDDTVIKFEDNASDEEARKFLEWLDCHKKCSRGDFKREGEILYHFVNLFNFFEGNIRGNGEEAPYERTLGRFFIEREVEFDWSPRYAVPETMMLLDSVQSRNFQAIIPDIWHFYCTAPLECEDGGSRVLSEVPAIIYQWQDSDYSRN